MDTGERYHFKVGAFDCIVIRDDTEVYPIGDLTADVSQDQLAQVLFDRGFPPAELSVDFACLLIDTGKHRVLVDTGWGRGTQRREGRLCSNLEAEGIRPQDINVIFITHSDRDHTGADPGVGDRGGDGLGQPADHRVVLQGDDEPVGTGGPKDRLAIQRLDRRNV